MRMMIEPPSMKQERHVVTFAAPVMYCPIDETGYMIVKAMRMKNIPAFIKPSICYQNSRELLVLTWDWYTPIDEEDLVRFRETKS